MVKELAGEVKVPIGLHPDDGSGKDLQTNIQLTKKVVEAAHKKGIIVEGEIGYVGVAANALETRIRSGSFICRNMCSLSCSHIWKRE